MLDKDADHGRIKDPARPLARRHQVRRPRRCTCGRTTASKATRSRRAIEKYSSGPCSAGRSRPPARPDKSTSMSMARWPDASWPRPSFPMAERPPWPATKCASPNPNSPFACATDLPARSVALHGAAGSRCGRHAASRDRDSGFAICGFRQRRRRADHRGQRLRAFVRARPAATSDWRALDLVEERPVITLRGQQFIGHGKNVLGDPRVALTWLANELRQLGVTLKAGRVVTTGTCHPPLPIQSGDFCAADFGLLGKVSVGFE